MMTITDVRPAKKGRWALYGEEGFLVSLDGETLAASGLEIGSRVAEAELDRLCGDGEIRRAKDIALRYLSLRAYGERELYQKLLLRCEARFAAAAVAAMCDLGLLNDETFAAEKAKGMAQRGKSPAEIRRKLVSLGIEKDLVAAAVCAQDIDGAAAALAVIRKGYAARLEKGEGERVMAALARRGFSREEIRAAMRAARRETAPQAPDEEDFTTE